MGLAKLIVVVASVAFLARGCYLLVEAVAR